MLVKQKLAECKLGLELELREQVEYVDNIFSTLAMTNCLQIDDRIDYYQ